jgi:hypothetical protein
VLRENSVQTKVTGLSGARENAGMTLLAGFPRSLFIVSDA